MLNVEHFFRFHQGILWGNKFQRFWNVCKKMFYYRLHVVVIIKPGIGFQNFSLSMFRPNCDKKSNFLFVNYPIYVLTFTYKHTIHETTWKFMNLAITITQWYNMEPYGSKTFNANSSTFVKYLQSSVFQVTVGGPHKSWLGIFEILTKLFKIKYYIVVNSKPNISMIWKTKGLKFGTVGGGY